jgi:ribosomal protein S27AE
MNRAELDKILEAHRATPEGYCAKCGVRSFSGDFHAVEYPCDTVKMLEGYGELLDLEAQMRKRLGIPEELETFDGCEHITEKVETYRWGTGATGESETVRWKLSHCPKCGDKL